MSIRRKSINDGTTISMKMKRTIDERETARYREEEENKASNLAQIGGPRTESAFDENTNETRCECQRRQAHRKSHRESQLHGENPYRGKIRGQVRTKTRLRCRKSQGSTKSWITWSRKIGVEHRIHRGDGARARDESDRTGLERWRDSSSRTRISTWNAKRCSGRSTRTPVHQETIRKLNSQTSRAEVYLKNAFMNDVHMTSPLTRHNHKGLALWWLITLDESSLQWVPARTPAVHWGRYDGRQWVARSTLHRAKSLTMTEH